jgi:hypothetical protein
MKRTLICLLLAATTAVAHAQPAVDAFGKCLADSTTGKDRKDLARWLFVAMGAHPDMKAISSIQPAASEDSARVAGTLFSRLITADCPKEAKAAVDLAGPVAFQTSFAVLGQLAMQELMADKNVNASMGLMQKYVDNAKVQAVLSGR